MGYLNGWDYMDPELREEYRAILRKCEELGHKEKHTQLYGRCNHGYSCEICGYKYQVDSSD